MAWNPSPEIADLRDLAKKWKAKQIIVLAIDKTGGTFRVNSYGETKELCDEARAVNDQIYNLVANGKLRL